MILEELIYKRFTESEELIKLLARFSGRPAVFSPEAPEDNMSGWENKKQYPRLIMPEMIEPFVRKCLKDVLLQPTGGPLYAFAWARTDAFDIEEPKNSLIVGVDIRFDILEYPNQETTGPDPVIGTNRFIKEMYPDSIVVGYDKMNDITEASKEVPVIYCRLLTSDLAEQTNTVAWMDGRLAVHILCPAGVVRRKMAMAIAQKLSLAGEVILLDKSPMFIRRLQIDNKSDYLKDGQVFITGRYGLLRYKAKPYSLNNTSINYS